MGVEPGARLLSVDGRVLTPKDDMQRTIEQLEQTIEAQNTTDNKLSV